MIFSYSFFYLLVLFCLIVIVFLRSFFVYFVTFIVSSEWFKVWIKPHHFITYNIAEPQPSPPVIVITILQAILWIPNGGKKFVQLFLFVSLLWCFIIKCPTFIVWSVLFCIALSPQSKEWMLQLSFLPYGCRSLWKYCFWMSGSHFTT